VTSGNSKDKVYDSELYQSEGVTTRSMTRNQGKDEKKKGLVASTVSAISSGVQMMFGRKIDDDNVSDTTDTSRIVNVDSDSDSESLPERNHDFMFQSLLENLPSNEIAIRYVFQSSVQFNIHN